jgi:probable F420-dependent oxidoreductase
MTQFGVVIPSWGPAGDAGAIRELVTATEELGFSTAWFADHLLLPGYALALSPANWYEALSCCIYGMGHTTRLRFGTDVLVAPYRDPRLLAKMAATTDRLSGGRLTLGLGVGFLRGEFEALEAPSYERRGAVTDETLRVLRLLFEAEGPTSFSGESLCFENVHVAPAPLQRPLPLWVGGNGRRALRRAAALGDGWHPLFPGIEEYRAGVEAITALRAEAGLAAFTFSYSCSETRITDSASAAAASAPYSYADMGALPDDYAYAPPAPRAADGRALFVGSEDQVSDDIAALVDAGVQHFALRFWSGDPAFTPDRFIAQLRRFSEQIAPRFSVAP